MGNGKRRHPPLRCWGWRAKETFKGIVVGCREQLDKMSKRWALEILGGNSQPIKLENEKCLRSALFNVLTFPFSLWRFTCIFCGSFMIFLERKLRRIAHIMCAWNNIPSTQIHINQYSWGFSPSSCLLTLYEAKFSIRSLVILLPASALICFHGLLMNWLTYSEFLNYIFESFGRTLTRLFLIWYHLYQHINCIYFLSFHYLFILIWNHCMLLW